MITILLPVNRISIHLDETLKSINKAQVQLWQKKQCPSELIVITNGIGIQDEEKIRRKLHGADLQNSRLISSKLEGIAESLNKGISDSNSEFIARADDDDLMLENRLCIQYEALEMYENLVLVGTYAILIDSEGRVLRNQMHPNLDSEIKEFLLFQNCFIHSSVMFRRASLTESGLYNPDFEGLEDYELWCRLSKLGKVGNIAEFLIKHRVYDGQTSHNVSRQTKEMLRKLYVKNLQDRSARKAKLEFTMWRQSYSLLFLNLARKHLARKKYRKLLAFPLFAQALVLSPVTFASIFIKVLKFHLQSPNSN